MTRETIKARFDLAGECLGILLNLLHQRGLEFSLAGASVINGRSALIEDGSGNALAPFLHSALSQLSKQPYVWAVLLIGIGLLHFIVLIGTLTSKRTLKRAVMAFVQAGAYVAITTAILTSTRESGGAERYAWSAVLSFLCFVVLTSRTISFYWGGVDGE